MVFVWPLLGAVEGRVAEEGLLETVVAFDVLVAVVALVGLGVSFEVRGVSFVPAFGVVGVSGAFSLLPDRETVGTLALWDGNFLGVPISYQ